MIHAHLLQKGKGRLTLNRILGDESSLLLQSEDAAVGMMLTRDEMKALAKALMRHAK